MLGFGENDIYVQADNHNGSWLYWLQQKIKRSLGFTVPIIIGRGLSHRAFGWMPYQRPIHVVGTLRDSPSRCPDSRAAHRDADQ